MSEPTLTDFLLARIAEDESVAERLRRNSGGDPWGWQPNPHPLNTCATSTAVHVNPARLLAECEAKRRIVEEHAADGERCRTCAIKDGESPDGWGDERYPCRTLRALASIYPGHP